MAKHKYFGLRADQPLILSITTSSSERENIDGKYIPVKQVTTPGFHLTRLQQAYMNSLSPFRTDSILLNRLVASQLLIH